MEIRKEKKDSALSLAIEGRIDTPPPLSWKRS